MLTQTISHGGPEIHGGQGQKNQQDKQSADPVERDEAQERLLFLTWWSWRIDVGHVHLLTHVVVLCAQEYPPKEHDRKQNHERRSMLAGKRLGGADRRDRPRPGRSVSRSRAAS